MTSTLMSKNNYKDYFERNRLKGNIMKQQSFFLFLMGKKSKGKEIEELTGIKHSQITSYKRIIKSGKIEELKNHSISKVLKAITENKKGTPKEDQKIIYGFENLKLDDLSDVKSENEFEDDENLRWEENLKRLVRRHSNDYTDELELWIGDLENQVGELKGEIRKLKKELDKKKIVREDEKHKKRIEELQSENRDLLVYKNFFEEIKLRMNEFP